MARHNRPSPLPSTPEQRRRIGRQGESTSDSAPNRPKIVVASSRLPPSCHLFGHNDVFLTLGFRRISHSCFPLASPVTRRAPRTGHACGSPARTAQNSTTWTASTASRTPASCIQFGHSGVAGVAGVRLAVDHPSRSSGRLALVFVARRPRDASLETGRIVSLLSCSSLASSTD